MLLRSYLIEPLRRRPGMRASNRSGFATPMLLASTLLIGCATHRTTAVDQPSLDADADASVNVEALGADATTPEVAAGALGGPLGGLDAALLARFTLGREAFVEEDEAEEGLGPVFNEASCVTCHDAPVGGTNNRTETRFGRSLNGRFDPLVELGGSLLQDHAIGEVPAGAGTYTYVAETVPAVANVQAKRMTTPLFGLGLVDAVPDHTFLLLARLQGYLSPSTAGTPHLVTEIKTGAMRVGRFGWKAQVPTLHQFAGDAYVNEMGVTNPEFPSENCPQGDCNVLAFNPLPGVNDDGDDVERFADFMTLLGPPPTRRLDGAAAVGAVVFARIGCANCHTPALVTGYSAVPALSRKVFRPYSDFLLHDMGTLADGIAQGRASGRQMRTAPLWGMGGRTAFLHDGRAGTPEDAILAHAGQGAAARDRFVRMYSGARAALLAFLGSL